MGIPGIMAFPITYREGHRAHLVVNIAINHKINNFYYVLLIFLGLFLFYFMNFLCIFILVSFVPQDFASFFIFFLYTKKEKTH